MDPEQGGAGIGAGPVAAGAGWFVDPARRSHARWYDGAAWTATIAVGGAAATDPRGLEGVDPVAARVPVGSERPWRPAVVTGAPPTGRARRSARRDARRAHREARRTYDRTVAAADRAVRDLERTRDEELRRARMHLAAAEDPRGGRVAEYCGIELYERVLITPSGVEVLLRGASASVDSGGSLAVTHRPTLTRAAAGGLLFGPIGVLGSLAARKREVHDGREVYLRIDTELGALVVQCPGSDGLVARQFATTIGNLARGLDALDRERAAVAAAARVAIARLEADTRALDAARAEAARARTDPGLLGAIEAAGRTVAALEAGPPTGPPAGEPAGGDPGAGDSGPKPLP